jgi:ABC-type sugar transport system ATPase subunit
MQLCRDLTPDGVTIVLVTHDQEIGNCAKRIVRMRDGQIVGDGPAPHTDPQEMSDAVGDPDAASEDEGAEEPPSSRGS